MRRISVRRMMLIVAGLAIACAIIVTVKREDDPESDLGSVRYQCRDHMRDLALAFVVYHRTNKHFPTGTWPNPSLPPEARLSWYVSLLPEIEQEDLYHEIDKTTAWNFDPNDALTLRRPGLCEPARHFSVFRRRQRSRRTTSALPGSARIRTILPKGDPRCGFFGFDRRTTLADITDGAANTLMIVESGRTPVRGSKVVSQPCVGSTPRIHRISDPTASSAACIRAVRGRHGRRFRSLGTRFDRSPGVRGLVDDRRRGKSGTVQMTRFAGNIQ